jgi:hypothetical protein
VDEEDDALMWQDALDEVAAGRTQNLRCPFCLKGEIAIVNDEQLKKMRLECKACRRFIEGRMGNQT